MQAHPVLGQLAIGYCPLVDAQRAVLGTRLSLIPEKPDQPVDAAQLLLALSEVWPGGATQRRGNGVALGTVLLAAAGEPLLRDLVQIRPAAPFALEVPGFVLADRNLLAQLVAMARDGHELWITGRPPADLPQGVWSLFRHSMFALADGPSPLRGSASAVAFGVNSLIELDQAIKHGAVATAGWPMVPADAATAGSRRKAAPELQMVVELINRVDREESIDRLEASLKGDPTLAFRLLRYLNSASFGLRVEISSLRHALMLLGYQKLKRWLALLLASASKDPNLRPVMFAAVRRGMFLEGLATGLGDPEARGEMFMCGVFSLLDRLLQQPFTELLQSLPVPDRVRQALVDEAGPYAPHLELARAIEAGSAFDVREVADRLMLGCGEINRALLLALRSARDID